MAGKIPQTFIDDLLNRVDIVDVIDARVPLKKAGSLYKACCPFHSEKTPSFTVTPSRQTYHCFGCGAHGTALGFLMEYEHRSYPEAIEELAAGLGIEVPREGGSAPRRDDRNDALYPLMERAADWFQRQLRNHPDAERAVAYLKQRGLSGAIAAEYGIGFAPNDWHGLDRAFDEVPKPQWVSAGMLIKRDDGNVYDRFRDRVMFPIRDRRGRVIAFGGRTLGDDKAKYLNSPETPIFHKGHELYGLFELRKAIREPTRILVVEGYMDVVALAQFGIRNAVATLGTATTREHLDALYRVVDEVVFCFDGDNAGRQAAWRALENVFPVMQDGRQARFLFLPEGEDPDTLVRKEGQEAFENRVDTALPLSDYFFGVLGDQVDMDSLDGRSRLAELARPHMEKLPVGLFRELMLERLSQTVRLNTETLRGRMQAPARPEPTGRKITAAPTQTPVRKAISILLHDPAAVRKLDRLPRFDDLDVPGLPLLNALLETCWNESGMRPHILLERFRDHGDFPALQRLARWQPEAHMESALGEELRDVVQGLERRLLQQQIDRLSNLPRPLNSAEKDRLRQLMTALHQTRAGADPATR
ncbi:MAG: DNA primase [Gammaproteobacteria bacterium]|nr:DNA primase [Gammaproteobacteria bacterium]MCP5136145.1 DNA primase [Gammaproteobacteria bacterium]